MFNTNDLISNTVMTEDVLDDRELALANIKNVLGARLYLTDVHVRGFFDRQKTGIGNALNDIDTTLPGTPRNIASRKYAPWISQNLQARWDIYMDTKWTTATEKHDKFMEKWVGKLTERYCRTMAMSNLAANKAFCLMKVNFEVQLNAAPRWVKPS
jgi:hypothetical protein